LDYHGTPIKPRAKLQDLFLFLLNIIEKGHQSGEGIWHHVRTEILLQSHQHFMTLAMVERPLIFKEKMQRTILLSNPGLTHPEETGLQISYAFGKSIIQTLGQIFRKIELKLDEVLKIQITLGVLYLSKH
jgi:hypothetical protein